MAWSTSWNLSCVKLKSSTFWLRFSRERASTHLTSRSFRVSTWALKHGGWGTSTLQKMCIKKYFLKNLFFPKPLQKVNRGSLFLRVAYACRKRIGTCYKGEIKSRGENKSIRFPDCFGEGTNLTALSLTGGTCVSVLTAVRWLSSVAWGCSRSFWSAGSSVLLCGAISSFCTSRGADVGSASELHWEETLRGVVRRGVPGACCIISNCS